MNKRFLALVLAFVLVFSSFSAAFADTTTIGADAATCVELGMLEGNGQTGVTPQYLATTPTRLQSAIMVLRLRGLEQEATAFTSQANFPDMKAYAWTEGKNIAAYLTAHPELGFIGSNNGNFKPNEVIDAQSYYKVMLEALGYKQTTPEVVGQFTWSEVFTFAALKGLTKANVASFTVNDIAVATVETLKAENGKLTSALIVAGKISAAKAAELGLVVANGSVKSVKAIANDKVEVEFVGAPANYAGAYKILVKGTTTALEVKSVAVETATKAVLTTAAQTAGTAYTLSAGSVSVNFAGIAKDTEVPELVKAAGTDTQKVELTFDKVMDKASATNVANYAIAGINVVKAELSSSRKVVTLTTEGMKVSTSYKVTVTNVKSADLVVLKTASKVFLAKEDAKAPIVSSVGKATNTRILVNFNEEVTVASAEDLANYSITYKNGAATENLDIVSAKLVEDANEDMTIVELTTASQKTGVKYTLSVNNIVDTKVLANKMIKATIKDFYGVAPDKSKPTATAKVLTDKLVEVTFTDASRMNSATMIDPNNYTFNNDISVEGIVVKEDNSDNKIVRISTSALDEKTSFKVIIANVEDEYGNVMAETTRTLASVKASQEPANVSQIVASSLTQIKVIFNKEVTEISAEDSTNYVVNNSVGNAIKAELSDDSKAVTLTLPELTAGKTYEVTINNIVDLSGNVTKNVKAKFVAARTALDTELPTIESIEALNNKVVRIDFSEKINVKATVSMKIGSDALTMVDSYNDDSTIEFLMPANKTLVDSTEYTITELVVADMAGNALDLAEAEYKIVYGVSEEPVAPELVSSEQITVSKIKLMFDQKVAVKTASVTVGGYTFAVATDEDDETIVYLTTASKMTEDKDLTFDLSAALKSIYGVDVQDTDGSTTLITTYIVDEEVPYVDTVTVVDYKSIELQFNEEIKTAGSYKITYTNDNGAEVTVGTVTGAVDSDDNTLVTLDLNDKSLNAKYIYTISVVAQATDIAGNKMDKEYTYEFEGTDVKPLGNYIMGVDVLDSNTINVFTFKNVSNVTVTVYDKDNAEVATATVGATATNKIAIDKTTDNFDQDATYTVKITGITSEFNFKGLYVAE